MSRNTIPCEQEDYLEIDDRIPGQNYVCLSFVSPEETLVQKELFTYHRFMSQVCGETEFGLEQLLKSDEDVEDMISSVIYDGSFSKGLNIKEKEEDNKCLQNLNQIF